MYNSDYGIEKEGWVCSKCGRSFAPYITECVYCNTQRGNFITTTTSAPKLWDDYMKRGALEPQRDSDSNWWLKLFNLDLLNDMTTDGLEKKETTLNWKE